MAEFRVTIRNVWTAETGDFELLQENEEGEEDLAEGMEEEEEEEAEDDEV